MKKMKTLLIAFYLFGYGTAIQAQEAVPASGGNASGSGGTASYSVGQVAYTSISNANGSTNQGVQQPYEFFTLAIDDYKDIGLSMSVYPNLTSEFVRLKVESDKVENLSFQLYDLSGRLLLNQKVISTETFIPIENLRSGSYFLKVTNNKTEFKTFKIIKTN